MSDNRDKQTGGSTSLAQIAGMTPIGGPGPSLDEQFGGGRNPFNVSMEEADRQMQRKIRSNGGK